nr:hypothetical protein [Ectorhizobium quercum]
MTAIHFRQSYTRPVRRAAATHLFAVGQRVRMKAGFIKSAIRSPDVYRITCVLPPQGTSFQYRIRNDEERHERVTTEDNLEPVDRN